MLFPLLSLLLSALSPTISESFANANYATFINFINFRVYRCDCIVAKILVKFFLLANNFGTGERIKLIWNESIILKCRIIKKWHFKKRTEVNSQGLGKLRANVFD